MGKPAILAIDQGTTNTKALLVGLDGTIVSVGSTQVRVDHPEAGWAEQSAADIRDSVALAIRQAIDAAPDTSVIGIAISNQRESIVLWDGDTGAPLGPCIIWQCRRSAPLCEELRAAGHADLVQQRTGLGLDPLFSAGKARWLLDRAPTGASPKLGTVDSWLLWNLTGGHTHATDASNAARTQLLALDTAEWDSDMLALFGIPLDALPAVRPSDSLFGATRGGFSGLPDGVPIHAMMGDSHAALYGHGITTADRVKVTIGTGSSLMCPTGARRLSRHGLSETVAWSAGGVVVRALEGNITVSGHTAAFACKLLGVDGPEALTDLALTVPDSDGVTLVPALAGLGAPHWDADARGMICGMSLRTEPAHVARAALEAIAHQICDVVSAMEADLGAEIAALSADGSAARSDVLLQMIADFSGRAVERPQHTELSAIGAAMMAASSLGQTIAPGSGQPAAVFYPTNNAATTRRQREQWHTAISRARLKP